MQEIEQGKGTIAYMNEEKEALVQHYTAAKAGMRAEEKRRKELEEEVAGQRQVHRQAQDRITKLTSELAVRQTQLFNLAENPHEFIAEHQRASSLQTNLALFRHIQKNRQPYQIIRLALSKTVNGNCLFQTRQVP